MTASLPGFHECFAQLIATPSVSSVDPRFDMDSRPLADVLANWLGDLGFAIEYLPLPDDAGKVNLVAVAGRGDGGLVLSGHLDTVPCDETAWDMDPFRLVERDSRFYGLGSTDMKSFFAIVMESLKDINLSRLRRPLFLLATCDEESSMRGARALAESGRQLGRHALIGEPTGLRPVNLHKGVMMEVIRLQGRSGHASDPSLGASALEGMHAVMTALLAWRDALAEQFRDERFKVPAPTLNFGSIQGGDNPNRICARCMLSLDLRPLPEMDLEEVRAAVRRSAMEAVDGSGLVLEFESLFPGLPGMLTPGNSEVVRVAEALAGGPAGSVAFGTEGPFLNAMGMETVILGPGDVDQAHQANEYLPADRIEPMRRIIDGMIGHFCMGENSHDR